MYKEIKKPVEKVTSHGFASRIVLSLSYEHHYDSVYGKQYIMNAAVCQCRWTWESLFNIFSSS